MKKIGILSDTHGGFPDQIFTFFKDCDEIWHCGDFGNIQVADKLSAFKPFRGVYGNIDGHEVRLSYPESLIFEVEQLKIFMIHIGGYPGKYSKEAREIILREKPGLFVCGHSHILKVIYDQKNELLHINPGAAGNYGMHQVITMVRFSIDGKEIKDLEIYEKQRY
jgi:hypothetical protein